MNERELLWRGPVTGLSHGAYGQLMSRLKAGTHLDLSRDKNNPYDEKATGVFFQGKQVGWIPKNENSPRQSTWTQVS